MNKPAAPAAAVDPPLAGPDTRRLSMILSGAISLGAYEAGVVSQIAYALGKWNEARPDEPPLAVIDVISGASAGAMTGVMLARHIMEGGEPAEFVHANFEQWCGEKTTFARQLSPSDDDDKHAFLSSSLIDELGEEFFTPVNIDAARIRQTELIYTCTLTSLDPIPFHFDVTTHTHGADGRSCFDMEGYTSRDVITFSVVRAGEANAGERVQEVPGGLKRDAPGTHPADWKRMLSVATASGAFPGAWQPFKIWRYNEDYGRPWNQHNGRVRLRYTDGGVLDNMPLGQASNAEKSLNHRSPSETRLYVLIEPAPEQHEADGDSRNDPDSLDAQRDRETPVLRVLNRVYEALREQSFYRDVRDSQRINQRLEARNAFFPGLVADATRAVPADALAEREAVVRGEIKQMLAARRGGAAARESDSVAAIEKTYRAEAGVAGGKLRDAFVSVAPERQTLFLLQMVLADLVAGLHDKCPIAVERIRPARSQALAGEVLGNFGGFLASSMIQHDFSRGLDDAFGWLARWADQENWLAPAGVIADFPEKYAINPEGERLANLPWSQVPADIKERISDLVIRRAVDFLSDEFHWIEKNSLRDNAAVQILDKFVFRCGEKMDWKNYLRS